MIEPLLYYSLPHPPLSLKGKAREGGLLETLAFGSILIRPAGHEGTSRLSFLVIPGYI